MDGCKVQLIFKRLPLHPLSATVLVYLQIFLLYML